MPCDSARVLHLPLFVHDTGADVLGPRVRTSGVAEAARSSGAVPLPQAVSAANEPACLICKLTRPNPCRNFADASILQPCKTPSSVAAPPSTRWAESYSPLERDTRYESVPEPQ